MHAVLKGLYSFYHLIFFLRLGDLGCFDGQSSTPHDINAGVPQGSILGTTLLLVYINNLPDGALSRIVIYADNATAYSGIQTSDLFDRFEMSGGLEEDLLCIVEWGEK